MVSEEVRFFHLQNWVKFVLNRFCYLSLQRLQGTAQNCYRRWGSFRRRL